MNGFYKQFILDFTCLEYIQKIISKSCKNFKIKFGKNHLEIGFKNLKYVFSNKLNSAISIFETWKIFLNNYSQNLLEIDSLINEN